MAFRLRPSSKKSTQTDRSLVQLNVPKTFLSNEALSLREMHSRMQQMQMSMNTLQEIFRKERDISNAGYIDYQKRLDILEYKAFTVEKDVKQLMDTKPIKQSYQQQPQQVDFVGRNQISLLKQNWLQDRQSARETIKHQNALIQQLNYKQAKIEQEIRELMNQQREEYDERITGQVEEMRSIETLKQRKIDQQYEMMKGVVNVAEKRIYDELEKKIRNETVVKDYIEDRIADLREELASDQKSLMSTQTKFLRESKQSVESLYTIINNNKKQLADELNQTQQLSVTNIKRLSMSLDLIRESFLQKFSALNETQLGLDNDMVEFRNFVTNKLEENRDIITEQLGDFAAEKEAGPLEGSGMQQSGGNFSTNAVEEKLLLMQKNIDQWKTITEQKNFNVFKEISNSLSSIKRQFQKQNDEISTEVGNLGQTVAGLKKSMPNELKKSVQTIISIFNSEFDVLAEELDLMTQMIALAKKENEKKIKQELNKFRKEFLEEVKVLIGQETKSRNLLIEKSIAESEEKQQETIQRELKFVNEFFMQKHTGVKSELGNVLTSTKKNQMNTATQLQDFTLKLKSFNENYKDYLQEQRKDDMKKRIQLQETMRTNASTLTDLCYKKCQYLVEGMKKAIEMNQMKEKLDSSQSIDRVKDQMQRSIHHSKQETLNDVNEKIDKIAADRESSEEVLHEAMEQSVNTAKKSMGIEIGNLKIQLEEKMKELEDSLKETQDKEEGISGETEEALNTLRETVWKIEAMSFSEQAKNKALFDRMGEDVGNMALNVTLLTNELKNQ